MCGWTVENVGIQRSKRWKIGKLRVIKSWFNITIVFFTQYCWWIAQNDQALKQKHINNKEWSLQFKIPVGIGLSLKKTLAYFCMWTIDDVSSGWIMRQVHTVPSMSQTRALFWGDRKLIVRYLPKYCVYDWVFKRNILINCAWFRNAI